MREEDNSKAIAFIVVAAIILGINMFGLLYGKMVDGRVEKAREVLRIANNKEYGDDLSKIIADIETSRKDLGNVLLGFVLKAVIGALSGCILVLPQKLYNKWKIDIFKYITPDDGYEKWIAAFIILISAWNFLSPLFEVGDYLDLYKAIGRTLTSLNAEALIKSLSTF